VVLGGPGYPAFLLSSPSPPPVLFYEGDIEACRLGVGVVGSRDMTSLGSTVADVAVAAALSVDAPVLSGLARGVDEYAHRQVLAAGGVCVGFAGAALDRLSAREVDLLADIVTSGGVVFSECPPGVGASAGSLLARNRLIAAGSCPLVPCEARLPGGTTACVAAAIRAGAPVVVPVPRPGHRSAPGARGLLALAGLGDVSALNWPTSLIERHRDRPLVNAVAHTREDLDAFIRVLYMFGRA
jgi:DNA processing protein